MHVRDQALQQRVAVCNDIVERLSTRVPEAELGGSTIPPQVEVLLALLDGPTSPDMNIDRLRELRPKTGLSQSALLTGSPREPSRQGTKERNIVVRQDRYSHVIHQVEWATSHRERAARVHVTPQYNTENYHDFVHGGN